MKLSMSMNIFYITILSLFFIESILGRSIVNENVKFTAVNFHGNKHAMYYLTAESLEPGSKLLVNKNKNYYTWYLTTLSDPSKVYLFNSLVGSFGGVTDLCISLSEEKNFFGNNYLNIVRCADSNYKFKYLDLDPEEPYLKIIKIFNLDDTPLTDSDGNEYCVYYDGYPSIDKCGDPRYNFNLSWTMTVLGDINKPFQQSNDGSCGNLINGFFTCPGNYCCSQFGFCGTSSLHCGQGCQPEYGHCD
ncbi:hypothetical protein LY90DRAFT_707049 [Neocallimastix californiae]|uniref:Chitin-binding type-1 domain-containing protein n=1 Tax=Neocallimastix californiae TaxID=1754190 RepID=A0A1Y2AJP8_9FUNG|nr:hypothetical protein LY90DRAFT_707049 [Neocallimastix californiae]|eukprot:ORY22724.1 hypothetical protein LY90DRAFT_707049 [Neocallimastix californiae]